MNTSKGMPIYGPMLEVGLYDPDDAPEDSRWLPFNQEADELASCLEACKQIIELGPLFEDKPTPRAFTLLATPVYSLTEHTVKLHRLLGNRDRRDWLQSDLENFIGVARLLRKELRGPLKKLRDKRSAHHDATALHPLAGMPLPDAKTVLRPLGQSLLILVLALNHDATFAYYRLPNPQDRYKVQIMFEYPIATLFRVDENGKLTEILEANLASDIRHEASTVFRNTIEFYNTIASKTVPPQPPIKLIERTEPPTRHDSEKTSFRIL